MAININDYSKFVDTTTSDESKHSIAFIGRVHSLTEETAHQPSKVDDFCYRYDGGKGSTLKL